MGQGLGSEHPFCDRIQLLLLIFFFAVWGIDTLSFFVFGYSTVLLLALSFPLLLAGTIVFFCISFYLVSKSHSAVFKQVHGPPKLVDSGVYAWIRHPMYLGTILFCSAFIFVSVSIFSIVIWICIFIFYDRMATFEEKNLIEMLGEQYIAYQRKVSKWLPGVY